MKSFLFIGLTTLVFGACATTSSPEPLVACKAVVESWAGQDPIQGVPQSDGGIIFVKPKLDGSHDLLVLVSKMNEPKIVKEVKQVVKTSIKIGECGHPVNGYAYTTLQFTVPAQLQSVGN